MLSPLASSSSLKCATTPAETKNSSPAPSVRCVARFRADTPLGVTVEWCGIIPMSAAQDIQALKDASPECALSFHNHSTQPALTNVSLPSLVTIVRSGFIIVSHSPQAVISLQNILQLLGVPYWGNVDFPAAYRSSLLRTPSKLLAEVAATTTMAPVRKRSFVVEETDELLGVLPSAPLPSASVKSKNGRIVLDVRSNNDNEIEYFDSYRNRMRIVDDNSSSNSDTDISCSSSDEDSSTIMPATSVDDVESLD